MLAMITAGMAREQVRIILSKKFIARFTLFWNKIVIFGFVYWFVKNKVISLSFKDF